MMAIKQKKEEDKKKEDDDEGKELATFNLMKS